MNKIKIGKEVKINTDDKVNIELEDENKFLNVKSIKIKVLGDTDIIIECSEVNNKYDIYINILENVKVNIFEIKKGKEYKFQYKYYLEKNSYLRVEKVNDGKEIKEMTLINLNGENSKVDYYLKTISKQNEKYNFLVYHNAKNTISNIVNNGVNILDGILEFNVSGFVPNGITGCDVSQSGRIINTTKNTCTIKPNLFIDENDVMANHSALIGTFNEEEIFYLMSRGINKTEAENLLTKGFLLKDLKFYQKEIEKLINKYWR